MEDEGPPAHFVPSLPLHLGRLSITVLQPKPLGCFQQHINRPSHSRLPPSSFDFFLMHLTPRPHVGYQPHLFERGVARLTAGIHHNVLQFTCTGNQELSVLVSGIHHFPASLKVKDSCIANWGREGCNPCPSITTDTI